MNDSEEDILYIVCFGAAAIIAIEECENKNKTIPRRRKRSVWVRDWVLRRQQDGCYAKLLRELELEVPSLYKNFLRMNALDFNTLLSLIEPKIRKNDTVMRNSISPGERLAITLRFLGTGESFKSLQYIFRIPQSTISKIVPEVCDAIYHELKKDFLKV